MSATKDAIDRIGDRVVVASISGGKDSAAMGLLLKEMGIPHRRVFMDTGWEHPTTYDYLRGELTRVLGPVEEIRGQRTMDDLIRWKGMFPGQQARFCTTELKVFPVREFIRALGGSAVNAVGIRADESSKRAALPEWEDVDPEIWMWRPLLRWTVDDVIAIHQRHGLRPNPLYLQGASRVGCWPCIFARKSEIRTLADLDPARVDRIRQLEHEITTSARARPPRKGETEAQRAAYAPSFFLQGPIDETVSWSRTHHDDRTLEMFPDDAADAGCMRWGMCETGPDQ